MARIHILRDIATHNLDPKVKYDKTVNGRLLAKRTEVVKLGEGSAQDETPAEKPVEKPAEKKPAKPAKQQKAELKDEKEESDKKDDVTQ